MENNNEIRIDENLLPLIPSNYAIEHFLIPVRLESENLYVAMVNDDDFALLQELMVITGKNVFPLIYEKEKILTAIKKYYKVNISTVNNKKKVDEFKIITKTIEQYQESKEIKDDLSIIIHINEIITKAINEGASDIHFEPYEKRFRVRFRLDGKLREIYQLPIEKKFAYISRLKIMSELDIAEKRRPQDGRIRMQGGRKVVDIRVSTMPTDFGEKVVLRILDKSNITLDIDKIGFTEAMENEFKKALQSPYGMILVTGPTGSGKTTTLYTALNFLNKSDVNIMTIEDPIEYNLDGINQAHVKPEIGFTFANALRSFLRQDPDIIMVGEIRDSETAEIAIRSALTGHLVLSTLHTNDAPLAITRLVDMGIEPFLVATSLRIVIAQRLVRKICPFCKERYTVDDNLLNRLGLSEKTELYRGKGCDYCNGTGYSGRTAVIEMLPITEKIADLIMAGASANRIRKEATKNGMLTLREHGLVKIKEGETTMDEVLRETMV